MFSLRYGKLPTIEESQQVGVAVCVRNYLLDRQTSIFRRNLNLKTEEDVKELINEIESGTTINLKQRNGLDFDFSEPNKVKLTYSKSNLGKGFVFWFICNICSRRVKYLYFPPNSSVLACRKCHKLSYDRQNESKGMRSFRNSFRL